jgi:PhnB protein
MKSTWADMPGDPKNVLPGLNPSSILHARFTLGDTIVMASDGPPDKCQPMRSAYLTLSVDSNEEAERIYKVLTEGGEVFMAMGETFFAHRFGQLRDKFGINWMIIHEKQMPRSA